MKQIMIALLCFTVNKGSPPEIAKNTFTVIISTANNIFYYENKLQNDASNFEWVNYSIIETEIDIINHEKGTGNVYFHLKIMNRKDLNTDTRKILHLIRMQKHFKIYRLNQMEKQLV
ncbi:MAG TPA: hypothetical protein VGI82_08990 [Chitinophagaceae bacterium]|jgi:hypothetical protein